MKISSNFFKFLRFTMSWANWHVVYYFDSHFVVFNKYTIDFWAFPTYRNRKKGIKKYINWSFHKNP